ncbi:iron complex outermembrane receptor protein [Mariniflexile fucanivorans]|uniref:Iron complex outermembrane receptor protein n=1 Tax=Mariniflexile fucanivorans TaxID=264023 RepID=A0A4R1RAQ0_9FLAO|nr:TonB-dependent receptor [Mariniflexile fucanivorans]TCL62843.1 iron complex outermembrane receptor protein [Mariniflexile fucanivorans]
MKKTLKIIIFSCLLLLQSGYLLAQDTSVYENMSLNEILNIDVVVTASKQPEDLFETPLSTTIISKEEIAKSSVTSIPEALRLSQGVIVREITPGNYDIHIRGYDDITKNVYVSLPMNTTTLVMIDNRIVYSYFSGGTFWETLPIDINDVERIEVVRGPASALYGPNAVTGVINIITSHAHKQGENIVVNSKFGTNNAINASVNIGYNWNDKTKLSFSSNFTERNRFNKDYFDFNQNSYTSLDDNTMFVVPIKNSTNYDVWTSSEFREALGTTYDVDLSLRKAGGNIFFTHNFSEQSNIDIAMGAQSSQSQKTGFLNLITPLSQIESESYYFNSRVNHKNLSGQLTVNTGKDFSNYKFNSYKFTNMEVNLEYFKQFKNLSIRPGINYKYLSYNSPLIYEDGLNFNELDIQFKDEPRIASSYSAFMLTEWKPTSNLRMIGAVRIDKFDINKNYFKNYELASTYRVDKNNLIRAVFSKANKSPFFLDSYLNANLMVKFDYTNNQTQPTITVPVSLNVNGQEDLKYPTITNYEIGWRTKKNSNIRLDLEMFYSEVDNFVNPNVYRNYEVVQQLTDEGQPGDIISLSASGDVVFENYNLRANQYGAGFTLNYDVSDSFKTKFFGTYQKTAISGRKSIDIETKKVTVDINTDSNTFESVTNTIMNPTQWSDAVTPSFFGGFSLNYMLNSKWNFASDAYIYSNQKFEYYNYYTIYDTSYLDQSKVEMPIKTNLDLNAKVTYQLNKNTSLDVTGRNLLGEHREFGFADNIGTTFLIGLQWNFK